MKRLLIILLTLLTAVACVSAVYAADGDGQSFQSVDYYCREALKGNAQSEKLLHVYDKIAEGMECSAAEIVFDDDKYDITTEELEIAMNAYRCDYAHHFWLGNTYTPWGYDSNGTLVITKIVPQYIISGAALTKAKNDLEAEAEKLLEGITPYMSEYERELLIHDRLASRIYYPPDEEYSVAPGNAHNAYGALVERRAVCEGYAEALQYLLHKVGISSVLVHGTSKGEGHEWNIVKIDGKYYHVDLTWDDPFTKSDGYPSDKTDADPTVYHAYFNISDSMVTEDHTLNPTSGYVLPVCNSTDAFYHTVNGTSLNSVTVNGIAQILKNNGFYASVYVPYPYTGFAEWYIENRSAIAQAADISGSFTASVQGVGREYTVELTDTHKHVLVLTPESTSTCTKQGSIAYYVCRCGKWFTSAEGTEEITDKSSVKLPLSGHEWTEKLEDSAHLKTAASDCRYQNEYWYDCEGCDRIGTERTYFGSARGQHVAKSEWASDGDHHWHECTYCDGQQLEKEKHSDKDKNESCDLCGATVENKLLGGLIDVPVPKLDETFIAILIGVIGGIVILTVMVVLIKKKK